MNWQYHTPQFEYEVTFQDASWPWVGHKYFGYDLVCNAKPDVIVELGTHKGTSFFSFCQAIKDESFKTKVFAVDTWKGDDHAGHYGDEIYTEVQSISKSFYNTVDYKLLRKTFDEALGDFDDHTIDILHIDGLHTYEAVKHDFKTWITKVKKDGIILFHDIAVSEDDFGVYILWNELKQKYATIEFYHSFGLGILFVDNNTAKEFLPIKEEMRMHYTFINESKKNEWISWGINHVFAKDQELERKSKEIKRKDQELRVKNQEIDMMKQSKFWKMRNGYLKLKKKIYGREHS